MATPDSSTGFDRFFSADKHGIITVPAMVKGQLLYPSTPPINKLIAITDKLSAAKSSPGMDYHFRFEEVQVIRQAVFDRTSLQPTGAYHFLVFAAPDPRSLIETDTATLARSLYALPFSAVQDYVRALSETLCAHTQLIREAAVQTNATSSLDDRMMDLLFAQIPALFDPESLGEAVDRELGSSIASGRTYLDSWVEEQGVSLHRGMMARFADHIFAHEPGVVVQEQGARVRAMPTRQLHITAGNSPFIPLLSFLRALASKGAAVIKTAADTAIINGLLAFAMRAVDPDHPITRHTSLVYWKGGDRNIEDVLFSDGAFDRLVVWGSPDTVASVKARSPNTKAVYLNPRYGLSLIDLRENGEVSLYPAIKASIDSMIANQKACTASLVHYVVGTEQQTLQYCRDTQNALAQWDRHLPQSLPSYVQGQIRMLRRGVLLKGVWFENGIQGQVTSAVVYMPEPFDIAAHPMARFIIVRRIDSPEDILPYLNSSVSVIGVYPETLIPGMRDVIAAAGVNNICLLGECERAYAGMPHDGMRILSELVNWSVG